MRLGALMVLVLWCISCGGGDTTPSDTPPPTSDMSAEDMSPPPTQEDETPDVSTPPDIAPDLDMPTEMSEPDMSEQDMSEQDMPQDMGPPPLTGTAACLPHFTNFSTVGPDYDQFAPTLGSHCFGTNHQNIQGVQQVIFFGDSVTVGTPNLEEPLRSGHYFRNQLAEFLAARYRLDTGSFLDWPQWKAVNFQTGKGQKRASGDFLNCSKWGARTDDFLMGGDQLAECLPSGGTDKRALIIFTMGGNDVFAITSDHKDDPVGAQRLAETTVQYLRDLIDYVQDPQNFPQGAYVVFANPYGYTDGTGDISVCAGAELGAENWSDRGARDDILRWIAEQYMKIAVETQTDMILMDEHFCGHGFAAAGAGADPANGCYRGPGTPTFFDETCIHPSKAGHNAIFEMFKATIEE